MTDTQLPTKIIPAERLLTSEEFNRLADVPPEIEWFATVPVVWTASRENKLRLVAG